LKCGFWKYFAFSLLLVAGCTTSPPAPSADPDTGEGRVLVSANVDSANIFLDNIPTGKVTPDTIAAAEGIHEIRLEKQGFITAQVNLVIIRDSVISVSFILQTTATQKVVLLEDFANVSCIPCVSSNAIIEILANQRYGRTKLLPIKYPTNFPSPNDPLYLANSSSCDSRIQYYGVLFAPTTIIDGIVRPISTDSIAMKDSIDARLSLMPPFSLSIRDSVVGGTYYVTVAVEPLVTLGQGFSSLRLQTVVTETNITFANPPGSNGETKFYDVMRTMLPGPGGEALADANRTARIVYVRQVALNSLWNSSQLHAVAFIQDTQTKEILQAGSTF